jgi:hypothetical protein
VIDAGLATEATPRVEPGELNENPHGLRATKRAVSNRPDGMDIVFDHPGAAAAIPAA